MTLIQADEERIELEMKPYSDKGKVAGKEKGTLAIRCRHAIESDVRFIKDKLKSHDKEHALLAKMNEGEGVIGTRRFKPSTTGELTSDGSQFD